MSHTLIAGTTGSGKSVFARSLSRRLYQYKKGIIVYDPYRAKWSADYIDADFDTFIERVNTSENCLVIVDESGDIGRYNKRLESLATQSRHRGHDMVFISQRIQQLSVTVRENCAGLYLFRSSVAAGEILADSWIAPDLKEAHMLKVGEYYEVMRMGACRKMEPVEL